MSEEYSFKKVFAAACLGMLLFGIVMISLGSILPNLMDKFDLTEVQAGALATILPLGILAGSLAFGPIVDRYSYRGLLIWSALMILLGLEGIAYADELIFLEISLFLIGAGGGAINGGTNALVADISADRPESRGANLSFLGVFFGVGALGTPAVLGALEKSFSYDQILAGIGLAIFIPILFFFIIRYPRPKHTQEFPVRKWLTLIRDTNLLLLSLFLFFQSGFEGIAGNWTTSFLQQILDTPSREALYALSLFILGLTVARIFLAVILQRIRPYLVLAVSILIALTGSFLIMSAETSAPAVTGLVMLGIGVAGGFPIIMGYLGSMYAEMSGTAFSLALSIALLGNMLANYAMGLIAESYGMEQYPVMLATFLILQAGLLAIILKRISGKTKI